jgi:invasion protein IalB
MLGRVLLAIALIGWALPVLAQGQQQAPRRAQPPAASTTTPAPPGRVAPAPVTATPASSSTAPAAASPEPAPAQPGRAWEMACTDPQEGRARSCRLFASVTLQPQNQRLLTVALLRQPETRSLALFFQVTHGTAIPAGLSWQVDDGDVQRLAFQNSDAEGLYVGIAVADDLLAALRRGAGLRVSFVSAARREAVTVAIPLAQFNDAIAEFFAAEREPDR